VPIDNTQRIQCRNSLRNANARFRMDHSTQQSKPPPTIQDSSPHTNLGTLRTVTSIDRRSYNAIYLIHHPHLVWILKWSLLRGILEGGPRMPGMRWKYNSWSNFPSSSSRRSFLRTPKNLHRVALLPCSLIGLLNFVAENPGLAGREATSCSAAFLLGHRCHMTSPWHRNLLISHPYC